MTTTWSEAQKPWDDAAIRFGVHRDDVQSWMLDPARRCDMCGTAVTEARCADCIKKYDATADSYRPQVIAARQGCTLVYSDGKDIADSRNATTDERGLYGLYFIGGVA